MEEERRWLDSYSNGGVPVSVFLRTSPDLCLEVWVGAGSVPIKHTLAKLRVFVSSAPTQEKKAILGKLLSLYEEALVGYLKEES